MTAVPLFRLVYQSRSNLNDPFGSAGIGDILEKARKNNPKFDVSGLLIFSSNNFAQVLEGPEQGVSAVFEQISRDLRHNSVMIVDFVPVEHREFANWRMAYIGDADRLRGLGDRFPLDLSKEQLGNRAYLAELAAILRTEDREVDA